MIKLGISGTITPRRNKTQPRFSLSSLQKPNALFPHFSAPSEGWTAPPGAFQGSQRFEPGKDLARKTEESPAKARSGRRLS